MKQYPAFSHALSGASWLAGVSQCCSYMYDGVCGSSWLRSGLLQVHLCACKEKKKIAATNAACGLPKPDAGNVPSWRAKALAAPTPTAPPRAKALAAPTPTAPPPSQLPKQALELMQSGVDGSGAKALDLIKIAHAHGMDSDVQHIPQITYMNDLVFPFMFMFQIYVC
jgi:hypothetical protein